MYLYILDNSDEVYLYCMHYMIYILGVSNMSDSALVEDYNNWKKYRMSIYDSNTDKPLIVQPDPASFFVSDYPFLLSAEAKKRLFSLTYALLAGLRFTCRG
jgi:hypothetical protein